MLRMTTDGPETRFEQNDAFIKALLPFASEGKLTIQLQTDPSGMLIRTSDKKLSQSLVSRINSFLTTPITPVSSKEEHIIALDEASLDHVCEKLDLKISGHDLIEELEAFNEQQARKKDIQGLPVLEVDFSLLWPDLKRGSQTTFSSRKSTRAISQPALSPTTAPLSPGQRLFIHGEGRVNNREFKSWYDNETMACLLHLLPTDESRLKPYAMYDDFHANACFLLQLDALKQRFEESNADIQTFTVKPETGAAHYYAGVIFRPDPHDRDNLSLLLFNPTGDYKKFKDIKRVLEEHTLFTSIYLSTDPVQTSEKDMGGLVSCGPISVEFVRHVQQNPAVLKNLPAIEVDEDSASTPMVEVSLQELDILPQKLTALLDDVDGYQNKVTEIRQEHFSDLGKIDDNQFAEIKEREQLGFDDDKDEKIRYWCRELDTDKVGEDNYDILFDDEEPQAVDSQLSTVDRITPPTTPFSPVLSSHPSAFFASRPAPVSLPEKKPLTQQEVLHILNDTTNGLIEMSSSLLRSFNELNETLQRLSITREMSQRPNSSVDKSQEADSQHKRSILW